MQSELSPKKSFTVFVGWLQAQDFNVAEITLQENIYTKVWGIRPGETIYVESVT